MEFNSIEDIKRFFGIEENDQKEISKEIKRRLSKVHNDKSNGEYKSEIQKREHEELTEALNFLKGHTSEIVITQTQWLDVQQKIKDLELLKHDKSIINIEQRVSEFRETVKKSGVNFQKKHFSLKLSSIIIGAILSALWLFPSMVEKNAMLNVLVKENYLLYTLVWLFFIVFIAMFWVVVRRIELKDAKNRKKYTIESVQHQMFKLFLAWLRKAYYDKHRYDTDLKMSVYSFNRDDLFNFILNYYPVLHSKHESDLGHDIHDLYFKVISKYERDEALKISEQPRGVFGRLFGVPGEIDIDLAQELTDILMARLIDREVIRKVGGNSFSDIFEYTDDD